jgi:hypothetical protein
MLLSNKIFSYLELTVPFIKDSLGKQKTPGSPYNKEHTVIAVI